MTEGPRPLENLVPLSALDRDETGYWRRTYWVCALFIGTSMVIPELQTHTLTRFSPLETVLFNAIGGLGFALLLTSVLKARLRLCIAGLYVGKRRYIDPPPEDLIVGYQLPCRMAQRNWLVPGVIYLGRGGLMFVAQKRIAGVDRSEIIPADTVKLRLGEPIPHKSAFLRLLVRWQPKPIEMSWNGSTKRFYVSRPAETIDRIRDCIAGLNT
jgi:hypothetical protein